MIEILQSQEFGAFVTNLLITFATILVPLVGSAIRGWLKSRESDSTLRTITEIVHLAVLAAEQAGLAGLTKDKKAAAIRAAQAMLEDRGIRVDLVALDAAIEAAVLAQFNRPKTQPPLFPFPLPEHEVGDDSDAAA